MKSPEAVLAEFGIERSELDSWIEQGWVRPAREKDCYVFDETDVARIRLIVELRCDLSIEEETVPVVLSLLDQLYAARRALQTIDEAIEGLPEPVRREIRSSLRPNGD
jgi:chaperone modulatory protein CbpM